MYNKHHLAINKPGTEGARKEHRKGLSIAELHEYAAKHRAHKENASKTRADLIADKKEPSFGDVPEPC